MLVTFIFVGRFSVFLFFLLFDRLQGPSLLLTNVFLVFFAGISTKRSREKRDPREILNFPGRIHFHARWVEPANSDNFSH